MASRMDAIADADASRALADAARRMPVRLRGRRPACEGCADADAALVCDCCGQELCRLCWGDGSVDLCQGCLGFGWDERPEEVEIARGLLR